MKIEKNRYKDNSEKELVWPYSLLGRVCVIETNDQLSLVHLREVLIKHRSLGMTDVKVTAGLRRETSDNLAFFRAL